MSRLFAPDPDQRRAWLRWAGCFLLLALELGLISELSIEGRWLVYRTIKLPLLKLALLAVTTGVAAYAVWRRLPTLPPRPGFGRALALHVLSAGVLALSFRGLLLLCLTESVALGLGALTLLGGAFGLSWLSCLLPPGIWWPLARRYGGYGMLVYLLILAAERGRSPLTSDALINGSIKICTGVLGVLGFHPQVDATKGTMGLSSFVVQVGYHCSGFEGIGLILVFLTIYMVVRRRELRFPGALVMLPLAAGLSYVGNGVRLACLLLLGAYVSPEVALEAFHSRGGWIAFVFLGFGFLAVVEKFKLFHRSRGQAHEFPSLPFLAPLALQLFLTLLFAAFVSEVDVLYPVRSLLVAGLLLGFARRYARLGLWSAPDFRTLPLGVLVYVLWIGLVPVGEADDPRHHLPENIAAIWLLARLIGSVFLVPVVEELAFRGYLLRRLQAEDFTAVRFDSLPLKAVAVSSLAFGLLHQAWFAGLVAGVAFAYAGTFRNRLSDAVVAHAVANLCVAVHVVVFQRWDLWV